MSVPIFSQPAATSAGSDARTNVIYAIERLKEKSPNPIPAGELIAYVLPIHKRNDEQQIALFRQFLKINEKVNFDPGADTYTFRPLHNIFTGDDLLAYLQGQETALGISVRDLKDGWADVEDTIDQLEEQHKLLVTRNKKDSHARMVWANDPTLVAPLDEEYREIWERIHVPDQETVVEELEKRALRPAGTVTVRKPSKPTEARKKKPRRGVKVTNQHMTGIFKDYSAQRPAAGKK